MPTYQIIVRGKVQGVFFRATAKKVAVSLGLTGWVKNTLDGDVEIMISGDEPALQEFQSWCWSGPPRAEVAELNITHTPDKQFQSFTIIR